MDFSPITEDLYIGTTPKDDDHEQLRALGVHLVINMRVERRPYPDPHNPPLNFLWLPTFDSPLIPIPLRALSRGALAALTTIQSGGKVYTHCAGGKHRGVAMGAAILIAQGYTDGVAMRLIKQRRPQADPYVWYIRRQIRRFAAQWAKRNG